MDSPHGDRIPHCAQNPLAAGGVGQGHAIAGRFAQHLAGRLVDLEDMPFRIGDDHRLENGLHHGIGKLLVHLLAAKFGVAEVAKPHGHAVEFGSNGAQVILGSPLDALLQFSLADAAGSSSGTADGPNDGEEKADGDHNPAQGANGSDGGGPAGESSAYLRCRRGGNGRLVIERGRLVKGKSIVHADGKQQSEQQNITENKSLIQRQHGLLILRGDGVQVYFAPSCGKQSSASRQTRTRRL